jgi:alpha-beta hydrolase superfamily lysophospholipase
LPASQVRVRWLVTALGLLALAALCCAYLSLCLLFAQGAWQFLYQPRHTITTTPAVNGLAFTAVRFGVNDTGAAELTGWWIPGSAINPSTTVLYLHDGYGSLSEAVPELTRLHALGCSVFAIDYRGFGASAPARPSERGMIEDARSAIAYLENTRHIPRASLVLWGRGSGADIAAEAAADEHPLPVVLEAVHAPALDFLRGDERLRLLPVRLILNDRLNPVQAVQSNNAPKLFLSGREPASADWTQKLYAEAAKPKQLATPSDEAAQHAFLIAARGSAQ